jgi:hypothetical protein
MPFVQVKPLLQQLPGGIGMSIDSEDLIMDAEGRIAFAGRFEVASFEQNGQDGKYKNSFQNLFLASILKIREGCFQFIL